MTPKVAVIQMVSGPDVEANLAAAACLVAEAAAAGAKLAVLPENLACMTPDMHRLQAIAEAPGQGPLQSTLADMARRHRLWLVAGTIPLCAADGRMTNTCLIFDEAGGQVARYDKIHLFDVDIPGGELHRESTCFAPGREVVVLDTPVGRLGLAICYDLRFPELFRAMIDRDAELIALPAAFTYTTGKAHWEVLLRARAIENQCFMLAAAQGGRHFPGRETFGHSLILGPWGEVLAGHAKGPGIALATLDREAQRALRTRFPVLAHRVL